MGWASPYIHDLQVGRTVRFRPRGHSMSGRIESGDLVEVAAMTRDPVKGDIVLCKVYGVDYLHLVSAVRGNQFQISNNRGRVNGWTTRDKIYGLLMAVNPAD